MTRMRNGAIKPLTDHSLGRLRLAPSIFSVPRKDLFHDFSSQVALEASYHAAKHFFSIGPFPHVPPIHVAIEGTSSIAAASSCLSHRISVEAVSIMTSMKRRGTCISVTAGGSGGIVRASGEPRFCSGGSRRRTSLRDSAPRGRSPASGSRSAPTGARRRRSARRGRWQGRYR